MASLLSLAEYSSIVLRRRVLGWLCRLGYGEKARVRSVGNLSAESPCRSCSSKHTALPLGGPYASSSSMEVCKEYILSGRHPNASPCERRRHCIRYRPVGLRVWCAAGGTGRVPEGLPRPGADFRYCTPHSFVLSCRPHLFAARRLRCVGCARDGGAGKLFPHSGIVSVRHSASPEPYYRSLSDRPTTSRLSCVVCRYFVLLQLM
jgi:hypothetical protein